jgi:hypothetical protein
MSEQMEKEAEDAAKALMFAFDKWLEAYPCERENILFNYGLHKYSDDNAITLFHGFVGGYVAAVLSMAELLASDEQSEGA